MMLQCLKDQIYIFLKNVENFFMNKAKINNLGLLIQNK